MIWFTLLPIFGLQAFTASSLDIIHNSLANQLSSMVLGISLMQVEYLKNELILISDIIPQSTLIKYENIPEEIKQKFNQSKSNKANSKTHEEEEENEEEQHHWFSIDWEKLPEKAKNYIKEHPYQTAFYVVNGVVFFAPELVWGPILKILGFTSKGPVAASFASWAQSYLHPIIAGSLFATLQSAAMGGYGGPILDLLVRIWTTMLMMFCSVRDCFGEGKEGDNGMKGMKVDDLVLMTRDPNQFNLF